MPKVLIVGGGYDYAAMFDSMGWIIVNKFEEAHLIQFTGGQDVSPFLYGEERHPTTGNSPERDLKEAGSYAWAVRTGKKMAGICRGGQFLNVMNGGKMYQDVNNHAIGGTHPCYDRFTGETHDVTSTHHQMMIPAAHGEVIAHANLATRKESFQPYKDKYIIVNGILGEDTEVVYYDRTKSLCFQPHPEFHRADSTRKYYFELLERYLDFKQ